MKILQNARDVFEHCHDMVSLKKEYSRGLYVNVRFELIHDELLSTGTDAKVSIHPSTIFKPAIENHASGLILVHNHPSGSLLPSDADIRFTKRLIKIGKMIGIALLDHIIVSENGYRSIRKEI